MPKGPVRRSQLISPFGVGSLLVVKGGTSLISGGLDHWFERESSVTDDKPVDQAEYEIEEWRLEKVLDVHHFYLPPEFRKPRQGDHGLNKLMTVPFLRFPQWHICTFCKVMRKCSLSLRDRPKCQECLKKDHKFTRYLVQVPFIAICEGGHLQDFPWQEWVHRSMDVKCSGLIKLASSGSASLGAQKVSCSCSAERSLAFITTADSKGSYLTKNLDSSGQHFTCPGARPWLGEDQHEHCTFAVRGALQSASNVYFAQVKSAIYLPISNEAPSELIELLNRSNLIKLLIPPVTPAKLRQVDHDLFSLYSDEQIVRALQALCNEERESPAIVPDTEKEAELSFRYAEFAVLREPRQDHQLIIENVPITSYQSDCSALFSRILLCHKLRETRALTGFTRVFPDNNQSLERRKNLMWRQPPVGEKSWLPAYVVFGEGIFLELNEQLLREWEENHQVIARMEKISRNFEKIRQIRHLQAKKITPRFVMLHTLAHILINRMVFECGYSAAALRERLYVSADEKKPMAGVLIYTAAGDSDGTMGGLVRLGRPGYLETTLKAALQDASWCSSDPVCMELGQARQGPESCNLAACHSCALVPETTCEEFNRFLDRAILIGDFRNGLDIGYFNRLTQRLEVTIS